MNIIRVPQGGRNFESFSEDPFLAGEMAAAYVEGVQSQKILATVKHFAANNQETDRLYLNVKVSESVLNEIYFPAFKRAIKAGALAVMSSYSRLQMKENKEGQMEISFFVKNLGPFDGTEISQLYVAQTFPLKDRPIQELKAFHKIFLHLKEEQKITFLVPKPPRPFEVRIGSSSRDIRLKSLNLAFIDTLRY